jgi:cytochrome c oxidase subunit 4
MDASSPHVGTDHQPHVLPLAVYLQTWGALLVLTGLTVGASYVDFGSANIAIALGIASIKALLVASIFMHLRYDQRYHSVIFGMGLLFTVIFVGFTMIDTQTRGRTDAIRGDHPVNIKDPFAGTRSEEQIRERSTPPP